MIVDRSLVPLLDKFAPVVRSLQHVIVVDDGLATGVTARAALRSLRAAQAAYLVLAAPVAAPAAAGDMRAEADQVSPLMPIPASVSPRCSGWSVARASSPRRRSGYTSGSVIDFNGGSYFFYHNGALPGEQVVGEVT